MDLVKYEAVGVLCGACRMWSYKVCQSMSQCVLFNLCASKWISVISIHARLHM